MALHVITISATKEKPHPITMTDDEGHSGHTTREDERFTTSVDPGDTLNWVISEGCAISEIEKIKVEEPGLDKEVFAKDPYQNEEGVWEAVAANKNQAINDAVAQYTISYIVDGKEYTEDPRIKMHSPKD
jgi:hypothetical protein